MNYKVFDKVLHRELGSQVWLQKIASAMLERSGNCRDGPLCFESISINLIEEKSFINQHPTAIINILKLSFSSIENIEEDA